MRELTKNLIALNQYKAKAERLITEQSLALDKLQDVIDLKDDQLRIKNDQLQIQEEIEKNIKKGYRRKVIGISVGSVSVGLTLGLLLPYVLN